jgi:hypothetical protein
MDGHLAKVIVSPEGLPSVTGAPAAYTTTSGVHVVFTALNSLSACPAGTKLSKTVSIAITPGSPPTAKVAWCGIAGAQSPIVTTTDGTHDAIVWLYDGGLYAMDGESGGLLLSGGGAMQCPVRGMTSPIAVKGRIILGGDGGLCSYSPRP